MLPNYEVDRRKVKLIYHLSPDMFEDSQNMEEPSHSSQSKKITWRGSPLLSFVALSPSNLNVPPVVPTPDHNVYVKLPISFPMDPYPEQYTDIWNGSYVRMPNSPESLYPVQTEHGRSTIVKRWCVIEEAFQKQITCVQDLRKAILSYNHRYEDKWKFDGLKHLLEEDFIDEERDFFFKNILPKIIKLALDLPKLLTRPVSLLKKKCTKSVTLSQEQIASLLANAFLCTFPRRNAKGSQTEYASYPDINFNRLFLHKEKRALEKLKCIIHYFKEVTSRDSCGVVTFSRQYCRDEDMAEFQTSSLPITRLHIDSNGLIEETHGLLQVDFANNNVLYMNLKYDNMSISLFFNVVNCVEQYSKCKGYASNFEWVGPHDDKTPRDNYGRRLCQVVALDALRFTKNPSAQYKPNLILRELQKASLNTFFSTEFKIIIVLATSAYVGFSPLNGTVGNNVAVATGNWGCGAFRGDPRLKGLIQIAAASIVGRSLAYFTFGDKELRDDLADVHHFLREEGVTVGQLVMALCQFGLRENIVGRDLLSYIYTSLCHYDSETESEEQHIEIQPKKFSNMNISNVDKVSKNLARSITDYFKPVSKSEVLGNGNSSSCERDIKPKNLVTEDKILKALNECDQLVKNSENLKEERKRTDKAKSSNSNQHRSEVAPSNPK
ncbi:Poly(ADP-ribose) glycohydrolase [Armadillidium vulgare]|nr:Poly(ADP-ribose) glycohydrolase [Armadillidium vulgare]